MSSIGNLASGSGDLATYLQQHKQGAAEKLFGKMDTDGDGKISKSELEAAFTAAGGTAQQADAVFAKLDTDGDGAVSKNEFVAAARGHRHAGSGQGAAGGGALSSLLNATSSDEVQNPDGSTTTTITTADGTKITITTPAPQGDKAASDPSAPKISLLA